MDKKLINDALLIRLDEHLSQTSFKTVDELIGFILEDYLDKNTTKKNNPDVPISDEVNQRLKDLGYL